MTLLEKYRKYIFALVRDGVPEKTAMKFIQHHDKNRRVWHYFKHYTFEAIRKKKKMGAKAIAERVRWEVEIAHNEKFKVANSYIAYYARIFEVKYPQYQGYFNKRRVRGLAEAEEVKHVEHRAYRD